MEFSNKFFGAYVTDLINLRQFKERNSFSSKRLKLSKINEHTIITKLQSINPNIDFSNLLDEMKDIQVKIEEHEYHELFDSPDAVVSRNLIPLYSHVYSDLKVPYRVKSDFYQTKKTRMYAPLSNFTPRGSIVPGQTLLITVSIYYPFRWLKGQIQDQAVRPRFKSTYQFFDGQTLEDLKKAFHCDNIDSEISGDISENPHKSSEYLDYNDLKHTLFYINNTIYIDTLPDEKTKNHANTMNKWAQSNGRTFKNVLPLTTKLLDLEVHIGEPYIFQHLGRCEHLFIFNDISFARQNNCLGHNGYPKTLSMSSEKLKMCTFCNKIISSVAMVSDNDRTPVTVNHMCQWCFMSFNYIFGKEKVSSFLAFRCFKWRKSRR